MFCIIDNISISDFGIRVFGLHVGNTEIIAIDKQSLTNKVMSKLFIRLSICFTSRTDSRNSTNIRFKNKRFGQRSRITFIKSTNSTRERIQYRISFLI